MSLRSVSQSASSQPSSPSGHGTASERAARQQDQVAEAPFGHGYRRDAYVDPSSGELDFHVCNMEGLGIATATITPRG